MQLARPGAREVLARASLDYRDVDARQCQFARQHEPGRACAHDQNVSIHHGQISLVTLLWPRRAKIRAMLRRAILEVFWTAPYPCWQVDPEVVQGSRFSKARPLAISSGVETWSCTINQAPWIFLKTPVYRTQRPRRALCSKLGTMIQMQRSRPWRRPQWPSAAPHLSITATSPRPDGAACRDCARRRRWQSCRRGCRKPSSAARRRIPWSRSQAAR